MNQRWRSSRDSYRPPEETIRTREYDVEELTRDTEAKQFVLEHHYEGSYPAARFRFGLYHHGLLVGVAVFSHPMNDKTVTNVFPGPATDAVELGRFVLLDEVPGNGETWFLARAFEQLRRKELRGVVSFSDPVPRTNVRGRTVFLGHIGTIYQAHNGQYLGRGTPRTLKLLPDGQVLSDRVIQKIRAREQGWEYGIDLLVQHGAPVPEGDLREWLQLWLPRITRPLRHPGNHKYAWELSKRRRLALVNVYPKRREYARTVGNEVR
jgi:hypothetical protein